MYIHIFVATTFKTSFKTHHKMKTKLYTLLLAGGLFVAAPALAGGGSVDVDTKASKVEWTGKKVAGQHTGTIALNGGNLDVNDDQITGGKFSIDMTSIACTDMEGEYADKLVGHLSSPDFFDVAKHSTATFVIDRVENHDKDAAGDNAAVTGNLTIKGISHAISFPANIQIKGGKVAAVADVRVDRTKYDIKYGSGQFFDGLGDNMIDDEFLLHIVLGAK